MEIFKTLSQNCEYGRRGFSPEAFVIHVTEGNLDGALSWCMDLKSEVSYHFIVAEDGKIFQLVETENTAWHAGLVKNSAWKGLKTAQNPNFYTIGIAFAGYADKGPTAAQIFAISEIIKVQSVIHNIKIDREHIIGHNEIRADKICPGSLLSLDAIVYLAQLR